MLTLQKICTLLWKGKPGDLKDVEAQIEKAKELEKRDAGSGWREFQKKYQARLELLLMLQHWTLWLLICSKHLRISTRSVVDLLSHKTDAAPLSPRDIGLFDADAGYHPLLKDPFETVVSLSGKAIKT